MGKGIDRQLHSPENGNLWKKIHSFPLSTVEKRRDGEGGEVGEGTEAGKGEG